MAFCMGHGVPLVKRLFFINLTSFVYLCNFIYNVLRCLNDEQSLEPHYLW